MTINEQVERMSEALGDPGMAGLFSAMESVFARMDWAEDEIKRAQRLRPNDADTLWHSFKLLTPTHDPMATEFVYRSHVRELLRRVGRGEDTRPATWAEIACACAEASRLAPMTDTGFGTYARAWNMAHFPMAFPDQSGAVKHVEALHQSGIDELTADLRRKLTVKDRVLGTVECSGMHHGETVECRFATTEDAKAA